jgi:hypothetical protein
VTRGGNSKQQGRFAKVSPPSLHVLERPVAPRNGIDIMIVLEHISVGKQISRTVLPRPQSRSLFNRPAISRCKASARTVALMESCELRAILNMNSVSRFLVEADPPHHVVTPTLHVFAYETS